jgi:hypothetical protein
MGLLPFLLFAVIGCATAPVEPASPPTPETYPAPVTPSPTTPVTVAEATTAPGPSATPRATSHLSAATPDPAAFVNGVSVAQFIILPPNAPENIRRIFALGQSLGRDPYAFSKIGDSISSVSYYFAYFDWRNYRLGVYEDLQPAIDFYSGSFERTSLAARVGANAWSVFTPGKGDGDACDPAEHMVACEFRVHNPSVALIRLGTNDTAPGDDYERAMRFAIEYCSANGIIPVLVTKSDRFEGDNRHNETLRRLAAEFAVPLWDFDVAAAALPNRGLGADDVHLTIGPDDDFTNPITLTFGYALSDLTGLMMLDALRQIITAEQQPVGSGQ